MIDLKWLPEHFEKQCASNDGKDANGVELYKKLGKYSSLEGLVVEWVFLI